MTNTRTAKTECEPMLTTNIIASNNPDRPGWTILVGETRLLPIEFDNRQLAEDAATAFHRRVALRSRLPVREAEIMIVGDDWRKIRQQLGQARAALNQAEARIEELKEEIKALIAAPISAAACFAPDHAAAPSAPERQQLLDRISAQGQMIEAHKEDAKAADLKAKRWQRHTEARDETIANLRDAIVKMQIERDAAEADRAELRKARD